MRTVSEELSRRWGQPIVIENRAGGGMNIGGRACAEAPPDGDHHLHHVERGGHL